MVDLVTKFRQNRSTLNGRSAGQRQTWTLVNTDVFGQSAEVRVNEVLLYMSFGYI